MMCVAGCLMLVLNITGSTVWAAEYEYDNLGRVTKVTYEDNSSVTYEYDANGNIVSVTRTQGEQETKPSKPQEETTAKQEETDSPQKPEESGGLGEEETGEQDGGTETKGQENQEQESSGDGGEIKRPGNHTAETAKENDKEPVGTIGISGTEQNPSKEIVTEQGTGSINETISEPERMPDKESDTGKIGFWQKVWNAITGFFLWLWSVITSFFSWLWSMLKGLFELIFGN